MLLQTLIFLLISTILASSPTKSHIPSPTHTGLITHAAATAQHLTATRTKEKNTLPHLESHRGTTSLVEKSIPGGFLGASSAASSLKGHVQTALILGGFSLFTGEVPALFHAFGAGIVGVHALPVQLKDDGKEAHSISVHHTNGGDHGGWHGVSWESQ